MTQLELRNTDVVVFIDETGHDAFHDPAYPVFGWGGCAMTVPTYASVADAWRRLKAEFFPGVSVMHAAELRRPSTDQLAALNDFFQRQYFARVVAVTRSDARFDTRVLTSIGAGLTKRVESVLQYMPFERIVIVFEDGETWNSKVQYVFGGLSAKEGDKPLPIEQAFMAKAAAEPGLEIADFIMHAAGGAARGGTLERKDFASVFRGDVRKELVSFMWVQSVITKPAEP